MGLKLFLVFLRFAGGLSAFPAESPCTKFPLTRSGGLFWAEVEVASGHTPAPVKLRMLVDTGWNDVSLTPEGCAKIHCKLEDAKEKKAGGGLVILGNQAIQNQNFWVDAVAVEKGMDGILGTGVLFAKPLLVDFKEGSLCFLNRPLPAAAKKLGMKPIPARYGNDGAWISIDTGGRKIPDVLVDSGADKTSLLPEHLKALKLKPVGRESRTNNDVRYDAELFAGIPLAVGSISATPPAIASAPNRGLQKLGMDVLAGKILGFDETSGVLYLGTSP
ncbi:hypothetical protein K2X33_05405 [bacterium]|nr:hypothetical protein [bacterium]